MHSKKHIILAGFSQKSDILKRNQSLINSTNQINEYEMLNKKQQINFVQRKKSILKVQKHSINDINLKIQNPNRQLIWNNRISGLNQSTVINDDKQDLNNEMVQLSQSFDLKPINQNKILRKLDIKKLIPPRSHSSMDKFAENQMKNYNLQKKQDQDKENHEYNLQQQLDISRNYKKNQQIYQNKLKINENQIQFNPLRPFNITEKSFIDSQNLIDIKKATNSNLSQCNYNEIASNLDLQRELETFESSNMINKQQDKFISTKDIIKDRYFHQDNNSDNNNNKNNVQNLIENTEKKCPEIKHIVSQSLGVSQLYDKDIFLNAYQKQNISKTEKPNSNIEQNLIEIYDKQDLFTYEQKNISNIQQFKKHQQSSDDSSINYQISNINSNNANYFSENLISQKLITEECFSQGNITKQQKIQTKNAEKNISFENLIKNEEERIKTSKLIERTQSFQNQLNNDQQFNNNNLENGSQLQYNIPQNLNIVQNVNSIVSGNKQIQYQNNDEKQQSGNILQLLNQNIEIKDKNQQSVDRLGIQNPQIEFQIKEYEKEINQQMQQQKYGSQNECNVEINSEYLKQCQNQKVTEEIDIQSLGLSNANRNQNLFGTKNLRYISENLMIQNQFYSQSPNNPILSTQATSLTDKSSKSIISNNKYQGQNKQNQVLFYNNKKKETNLNSEINEQSDNLTSFQVNRNQEQQLFQQNNEKIQQIYKKNNISGVQPFIQKNSLSSQLSQQSNYQKNQINFHNFLEDFNFDNISIGPNKLTTKSSSKSRRTPNQFIQQIETNPKTTLSQQNREQINNYNMRSYSNKQGQQINQISNQKNQFYSTLQNFTPNYIKSSSSMGFQEEDFRTTQQKNKFQQQKTHNIIQNPPQLALSQTQDSFCDVLNFQKHDPYNMYGNTMPLSRSKFSKKSTDNQNISFEFHEMTQQPNYRSISQQSSREQAYQMSQNTKERMQGSMNLTHNHLNISQLQCQQPFSLNFVPPSCSSAQSIYSSKAFNQKIIKLNKSTEATSQKNNISVYNYQNIMKEIYTELDEDARIYDFSPKKIQSLKQQNQILKSSMLTSSNFFDFYNTNTLQYSNISRTNGGQTQQPNDFKIFNDTAKQCINKLENARQQGETNTLINCYMDSLRSRISQLKNKKKNTEIDLILINAKIISDIESFNTDLKQKIPHHLNKQFEDLYQQIKKDIFIYSCQ